MVRRADSVTHMETQSAHGQSTWPFATGIGELQAAHPEPELRYTYRLAFVAAAA
jgi:hypothetical protein